MAFRVWAVLYMQAMYVATGVVQTLSVQILHDHGGAEEGNLLVVMVAYLGIASAAWFPLPSASTGGDHGRVGGGGGGGGGGEDRAGSGSEGPERDPRRGGEGREGGGMVKHDSFWWDVGIAAFLDLAGHVICTFGVIFAGSGLYQVFYSTIIVFIALASKVLLHKRLNAIQWSGVALITLGLATAVSGGGGISFHTLVGIGLTIAGTFIYSLFYVWVEHLLKKTKPPSPTYYTSFIGMINVGVLLAFFVLYTLPRWNSIVSSAVFERGGKWTVIWIMLFMQWAAAGLHSSTYYGLINSVGGVSVGVLNGLRSVGVFALSSLLFCRSNPEQCYTFRKGIATCVVVTGVVLYSYAQALNKSYGYGQRATTTPTAIRPSSDLDPKPSRKVTKV